jgi:acyl-coenzyme A synthetase/AMP-(fatty) acid ligase
LRLVFFAGEPLHESLVRRWRSKFPAARIVNLYGPTETTMVKFFYEVPAEPDPGVQPAGWPMPETQGFLLDEHGAICDLGEVGEIVVRTPEQLMRTSRKIEWHVKVSIFHQLRANPNCIFCRATNLWMLLILNNLN